MIQFKIYNDDKIRHWANFPTLKDPYVLENTLLRIINELFASQGQPLEKEFNIHNPRLTNMHFVYFTSSNFRAWGELPLGYIYNDMVRHIQNRNTSNNFIMTLESIFIDNTNSQASYDYFNDDIIQPSNSLAYEIVSSYISENYLNSYNYIINNNNGILVVMIPTVNGTMCYIIAVGFDPVSMAKWFCTKDNLNDVNSLPFARYMSLRSIVSVKLGGFGKVTSSNLDLAIDIECSDSRVRENINYCINMLNGYEISALKKKSFYDTEVKYGNFPIGYEWLYTYDISSPALYYNYTDRKQEKFLLTKFNQPCDYRVDYRILKRQNDLIKIAEKRKEIGVGS